MRSTSRGDTFQFRIPGDPKYVSMVRRAVRTIAVDLGFPESMVWEIEVSVAEALANAVEHGTRDRHKDNIMVACKFDDGRLTIDVRDEGPGFDLPCTPEVPKCTNERGRGLRLIYELMDNVKVLRSSRGWRLRMVKDVQAKHAAAG